jgi:acetoin utilization deacetylase AcuC-like enzyme
MIYIHSPASLRHDPRALSPDHPDNPSRLLAIEAALDAAGLDDLNRQEAPAARPCDLRRVHSDEHVAFIRNLCRSGGGKIDQDTFVGEASYAAALHAAGGACDLVRMLMAGVSDTAFCALRPAGHHAERDRAMGFCLFNNMAIAVELAISEHGAQRVMVIDWDVHHGNGTAETFRRRADVLVCDIHQTGLFPGTGAFADAGSGPGRGYTVNLPVPAGSNEEVWLSLLEHVIVPIGLEYRPELVLISAGFDAHEADPLGECRLQSSSFGLMACHVRELGGALDAPVGAILEGGYDPAALAESTVATIAALQGRGDADSAAPDPLVTPRVASHLAHRWTL